MQPYDFDFFVIGGGSGGVRASRVAEEIVPRGTPLEPLPPADASR
jgi:hypothetical protein